MVTYITAQYRHVVVCSGLYPVRSQSLHGGYSSGCFESAMQPSSTEKSSRTTLHYVIQNNSARDLVLPPLHMKYTVILFSASVVMRSQTRRVRGSGCARLLLPVCTSYVYGITVFPSSLTHQACSYSRKCFSQKRKCRCRVSGWGCSVNLLL